ncbi:MAG: hypothetical protein J7576_05665 [Siphonobacter aquaeclarae]|nr:hypothetical protein [Siphonobacter aquaeclarae]
MKPTIRLVLLFLAMYTACSGVCYGQLFIQEIAKVYTAENGLPKGKITGIKLINDVVVAWENTRSYQLSGATWQPRTSTEPVKSAPVLSLVEGAKVLSSVSWKNAQILGTEKGLYRRTGKKTERLFPSNDTYNWALRHVSVVLVDSRNRLWFAAEEGVGYLEGNDWHLFTGKEGLPYNQFTCGVAAPDGSVWFGTTRGAIKFENGAFKYRFSRRWLPGDYVNEIAVGKDGTAWFATDNGVGRITPTSLTLKQKADYFTQQVEQRHNRMGFITHSHLTKRFAIESSEHAISDNDGMYTAMYGAAQAFRYAATRDPEAKALADRCFKSCKWLVDITHESGFPARVIIPVDWPEPVNEQYGRAYNKRQQESDPMWKDIYPRFPLSKDGKYRWKCDTSSDELAGHFFFYGVYYDLVAETSEEKKAAQEVVAAITDHMIRHGYKLVDHDGKVTRWGNFSPEYFHSVYGYDQRGLNSMMMLSFLNVAKHVTGDSKYDLEADKLRKQHNYHIFSLHPKEYFPPENVVSWDHNLCLMSLYGLIKYETDPSLLLMYRQALENAWLHVSKQKNAFWDTIYQSSANGFTDLADRKYFEGKNLFSENHLYAPSVVQDHYKASNNPAFIIENLQQIPLDLIGYAMDNTHRLDIVLDPMPRQDPTKGWRTDGYALPIDERGHVRQDRDGFALKMTEGDGQDEHEGTFFLLPYYMAVYHKLIQP